VGVDVSEKWVSSQTLLAEAEKVVSRKRVKGCCYTLSSNDRLIKRLIYVCCLLVIVQCSSCSPPTIDKNKKC